MKRALLIWAGLPLLLAGCTPETIVWSTDGEHALVQTRNGLYLATPDGKQSEKPVSTRAYGLSTPAAWVPGSHSFVVVEATAIPTWKELETVLGPEASTRIAELAERIKAQAGRHAGDPMEFTSASRVPRSDLLAAWIHWRDADPDGVAMWLAQNPTLKQQHSQWQAVHFQIQLFDLVDGEAKLVRTIHESFHSIGSIRLSPDGRSIAWTEEFGEFRGPDLSGLMTPLVSLAQLKVCSLAEDAEPVFVADSVSFLPAWSPDARSIYFARVSLPQSSNRGVPSMGILCRSDLSQDSKGVAAVVGEAQLAVGTFAVYSPLHVTPSGEVIFSSSDQHLPALLAKSPAPMSLFRYQPGETSEIQKIEFDEDSRELGDAIGMSSFAVSPDGTRVAITTKNGMTAIVTVATGQVQWIEKSRVEGGRDKPTWEHRPPARPAWRTNDELTFATPPESSLSGSPRTEIALWSPKGVRMLSKEWKQSPFGD